MHLRVILRDSRATQSPFANLPILLHSSGVPNTAAHGPARAWVRKHAAGAKAGDSQAWNEADSESSSLDEEPEPGRAGDNSLHALKIK